MCDGNSENLYGSYSPCLPSLFVKNKPGKLVSSLRGWLFAYVFENLCTENRGKLSRKILRQHKNRNFSILNSSAPSQKVEHRVAVFSKTFYLLRQQKKPSRSP